MNVSRDSHQSSNHLHITDTLINYLSQIQTTCDPAQKKVYKQMLEILSARQSSNHASLEYRASLKIETSSLMPEEMQAKIALSQLQEVQASLKQIGSLFNLNTLYFLTLGYVRHILILECLLKILLHKTNQPSLEDTQKFFSSFYQILKQKPLNPKPLLAIFEGYITSLNIPKEVSEQFKKLIIRLQIIGLQTQCQEKTLLELGFPCSEMDTKGTSQVLKNFIELQEKLFQALDPIVAHTKNEYSDRIKQINNTSISDMRARGIPQSFFGLISQHKKEWVGDYRYCSYYLKMRNKELRSSCKSALNPSTEIELMLRSKNIFNQLLRYTDKLEKPYGKVRDDLNHFIVGTELILPLAKYDKKTESFQKEQFALEHLAGVYYTNLLFKWIDELFDQLKDEQNIAKTNYIDFILTLIRMHHLPLDTEEERKVMDSNIEENFTSYFRTIDTPWCEPLCRQLLAKMRAFKEKFYKRSLTMSTDHYRQIKYLELPAISDKENDQHFFVNFVLAIQEVHKQYKPNTKCDQLLPFKQLFHQLKERVYDNLFSTMESTAKFKEHLDKFNGINKAILSKSLYHQSQFKAHPSMLSLRDKVHALKAGLNITYQFLVPGIQSCHSRLDEAYPTSEEITSAWLLSIDQERLKNQSKQQKNASIKETETKKKVSSKKRQPVRTAPVTVIKKQSNSRAKKMQNNASQLKKEAPTPLNMQIHPTGFTPPHTIAVKEIDAHGAYAQDQAYHLNHCLWTMDLLCNAIRKNNRDQIALLGANLIDHLYLAQEQGITPLYLAKHGELRHGLKAMGDALNIEYTGENNKGSLWVRYPYASARYCQEFGIPIPLGLEVVLALSNPSDTELSVEQIGNLNKLTVHGVNFLHQLSTMEGASPLPLKEIENKVHQWNSSIQSVSQKDNNDPTQKIKSCLYEQKMILDRLIEVYSQKITYITEHKSDIKPDALKDLLVHIKRLRTSIQLFEQFPQQKYLSVHEHNIRSCGQYIPENCFSFISQLDGDEFHTHNFKVAHSILRLEDILSTKGIESLQEMNIKKGGDYPYWEFIHHKAKNSCIHPGLKNISEAYELSMEASASGEGFLPSSYLQDSLKQKHARLVQLISQEIDILQILTTYITKRLSVEDKEEKEKEN